MMCYNIYIKKIIYKIESCESEFAADYAIRYIPTAGGEFRSGKGEYAKIRGRAEFKTDFGKNNTGYEVLLGGKEVTKAEYASF